MSASDTNRLSDIMPWSPLSATASIFPLDVPAAQDDVGSAWLGELGGPVPFGCDRPESGPEQQG